MQLRKNPPFEINADDPFQDDRLGHKPTIELLSRLIQSTEQPFVLTVEAPWGWGKTKFIERWKAHLSKEGHVCLYFNAWENDFVSDPLLAFIGELNPIVEAAGGGMDETSAVKKGFARLKNLGASLAKKSAPILVKAAVSKALGDDAVKELSSVVAESADKVAESLSEAVKNQIDNYEEEKKGIRKFREALGELGFNVTEK
jgi:predicted KAP-like P-loop ATPase